MANGDVVLAPNLLGKGERSRALRMLPKDAECRNFRNGAFCTYFGCHRFPVGRRGACRYAVDEVPGLLKGERRCRGGGSYRRQWNARRC